MNNPTMIIVAASVLFSVVLVVVMLRRAGVLGPRNRVLSTGTPGTAVLVGIQPTGTVVNQINYVCRLQLRVQLPGNAPYDVETREMVPITAMGAILPGTVLAVRVDSDDPSKVFVDWNSGIQPAPFARGAEPAAAGHAQHPGVAATRWETVAGPLTTSTIAAAMHDPSLAGTVTHGSAAELLRTGQPVHGTLRSYADTGQTPRMLGLAVAPEGLDDPVFALEIELQFGPGTPPVPAMVIHRVPRSIAPTLYLGMPLACAVDPGNPTRNVAVRWDAGSQVTNATTAAHQW